MFGIGYILVYTRNSKSREEVRVLYFFFLISLYFLKTITEYIKVSCLVCELRSQIFQ